MASYANTNFALFEEDYDRDGYIPPQLIENEYGGELVDNEDLIESGNSRKSSDTTTCNPSAKHTPNQGPEDTYT